jgi:hypothetical protein
VIGLITGCLVDVVVLMGDVFILVCNFYVIKPMLSILTDPYGRNLGSLDRSRYFFFQEAPQLYSEAEWTQFQTHYLSENLVAPASNPDLWIRSQEL